MLLWRRIRRRHRISLILKILLGIFGILVVKKIVKCHMAMNFMRSCRDTVRVQTFDGNVAFDDFVSELRLHQEEKPSDPSRGVVLLMLNKFAMNITFNWLCNVKEMLNSNQKLAIVALDYETHDTISRERPDIVLLYWPIKCFQDRKFSFGDGPYQLMLMFRASLTAALASRGLNIWNVQADTFWRDNLFDLGLEKKANQNDVDILLDVMGHEGFAAETSSGGYLWVRGGERSAVFFSQLSELLAWWYVPDNTAMTALCRNEQYAKCSFIPYSTISGWQWLSVGFSIKQPIPYLFQFDAENGAGDSKMQTLAQHGLIFTRKNTCCECDPKAVQRAINLFPSATPMKGKRSKSWMEIQLHVFIKIANILISIPGIGIYIKQLILYCSYFFMITMT